MNMELIFELLMHEANSAMSVGTSNDAENIANTEKQNASAKTDETNIFSNLMFH